MLCSVFFVVLFFFLFSSPFTHLHTKGWFVESSFSTANTPPHPHSNSHHHNSSHTLSNPLLRSMSLFLSQHQYHPSHHPPFTTNPPLSTTHPPPSSSQCLAEGGVSLSLAVANEISTALMKTGFHRGALTAVAPSAWQNVCQP